MDDKKHYDTGAVRSSDCEATRYDLISPIGLESLARTYAEGAKKFGAFNWENGMPVNDLLNHAIAHIYKFLSGNRDEDHLGHATWNLIGAVHSLAKWPELNDHWLRGKDCSVPPFANTGGNSLAVEKPTNDDSWRDRVTVADLEQLRHSILAVAPDLKTKKI